MHFDPGTQFDRYILQEVLGEGGLAVVYRATHAQLDTLHAVKVLKSPSVSVRRRLLLEGKVQAKLRHPNIVAVTDVIDANESLGLVMEYVEGRALDEYLFRHRLTLEQADQLARGILAAVQTAHDAGLIHRDLKPANILLKPEGTELVPKITDFGLAKILSQSEELSKTRSGVAMGTPAYMAPEQIRDAKNVDQRADIFALGAILYELVSGRQAFQGDDLLEIFNRVASAEREPLSNLVPDLPERMASAIEGALLVDIEDRFQSTNDLLQTWVGGTPRSDAAWTGVALRQGMRSSPTPDIASDDDEVYAYADAAGRVGESRTYNSGEFGIQATERPTQPREVAPISAAPAPLPAQPAGSGASRILPLVLGLGLVLLLFPCGWWLLAPTPTQPVPVPVPIVQLPPPPAPAPVPEPAVEPTPEPATPAPAPLVPKPIAPVAPKHATVTVEGAKIRLVSNEGSFQPGKVPPGRYRVVAQFPDAEVEVPQRLQLSPGQKVRLVCDPVFYTCNVK